MTHPDQAIEGVDSFARAILTGERGKLPNGVTFSAVWKSGDSVEVALYSGVSRVALLVGNVDSKGPAGCGRTRADVAQPMARTLLPMAEKVAGQTIEQEIQAKGLTAARVTPADIEENIVSEHYFTAADGVIGAAASQSKSENTVMAMVTFKECDAPSLGLLTFCVLVLRNGFTVTGESACASPENFDAEVGRKIARQNAVSRIWPLMGYELRTKLADS